MRPVTETSAKQYSRVKTSRGINVSCTDSGVMYTQIERKGCLKNQGLYGGLAGRSTKENTIKWMRASNYELDSIQVLHIGQLHINMINWIIKQINIIYLFLSADKVF